MSRDHAREVPSAVTGTVRTIASHGARRRLAAVVALTAAVVLAGCAAPAGPAAGGSPGPTPGPTTGTRLDPALVGRTFVASTITTAGAERALVAGTRIWILFTDEADVGPRVSFSGGCNGTRAEVTTDRGRITVSDTGATTTKHCEDAISQQDDWLFALLRGGPTWRLTGDTLRVEGAADAVTLLDLRVAEPRPSLAGRTWQVDRLTLGGTPVSYVDDPAHAPIQVSIVPGGELTVFVFCANVSGRVTITADRLTGHDVRRVATVSGHCSAEESRIVDGVTRLFSGVSTYTVDSRRLTLTDATGDSLSATT